MKIKTRRQKSRGKSVDKEVISQEETKGRMADDFFHRAQVVQKTTPILEKRAGDGEFVITYVNGVETWNAAKPGDYIVTGMLGEQYDIKQEDADDNFLVDNTARDLPADFELGQQGFRAHKPAPNPRLVVQIKEEGLPPKGQFMVAWGFSIRIKPGDYVVADKEELYRFELEVFLGSYEFLEESATCSCCQWG